MGKDAHRIGKIDEEKGSDSQIWGSNADPTTTYSSSRIFWERCCPTCIARIAPYFTFKCFIVLVLSLSVFISALFLLIPSRSLQSEGYDSSQAVKLTAPVQAYFRLQKPVSQLVTRIQQLEYELYMEIGVPYTKVTILSMHKSRMPDSTYVVFGILPDPKGDSINPVSLSVLKSTLTELFLQEANLTLTNSLFGVPASFEILKFRGGITVMPKQLAPVSQIVQSLFNFTLDNSIYDVKENLVLLTKQLKTGLHLRFDENVYVQVTNKVGSTMYQPVIVQASILSDSGSLQPQRLKQLAKTLENSSLKNLGLNNTMFGKVKSVSLSSYLSHTLEPDPPSPSPSPSPSPEPSLRPCFAYPPHTSARPHYNDYLSPCPSPIQNLPQSPVPSLDPPSAVPHLSPHTAAQPSSDLYDDSAPVFYPFLYQHHIFMQNQEKSSGNSLAPRMILSSGTYFGNHILVLIILASHLLYWLV